MAPGYIQNHLRTLESKLMINRSSMNLVSPYEFEKPRGLLEFGGRLGVTCSHQRILLVASQADWHGHDVSIMTRQHRCEAEAHLSGCSTGLARA